MDSFLYFSALQGVLAFFAPCAVALLPAYVTGFVSRNQATQTRHRLLLRGLKLASLSILGVLAIYATAGLLIVVASELVREYTKWVAIGMGGVLVVLGILMLMGRNVSLNLHIANAEQANEAIEAVVFGVAYAVGALGCLFPLFLIVATQALAAPSAMVGASYVAAYFLGLSSLMAMTIVVATLAKEFAARQLRRILPYMERVTGLFLILAGIYVIDYQLVLV
jgi:cytochrome c-type biogenesis protein